ncbi:tRNA uridine-5-carboxymethylaminomethyl(34) synthesis GTPase MnmE [Mycoplasma sp. Mirounga ES2805-ORL]|uniref:tRNA uridine-5-carboxymethylaminomethyl(34) synthesis GTPase MnmE n=1 Tax=Mycoplasma sp. Mirounga ES2805-ORL TaxID=754514 RepID=UPI00197B64A6|nr:tRNA uridine-5-carboxymethylaminomethyl(34) synthesis GTPase MnmE [Mycoplasma sp. Mirounga ES2805-ORL]QSF13669.1 tRNA uridine-5-carboxymethylaminomethyl(34) synthesis GTPase MnmE [Mycoplasma sp. Mirounga ES2805-ORL]
MFNDTIAAISSGGKINQAISIIRVAGPEAITITKKIFTGKIGKNQSITFGKIIDNFSNKLIDEVLVAWFIGKNNFVGQDTVEINCHGGVIITNIILELLIANGARLATPGEFSRRSFLNGKMSLVKAEAINDLIHAQSKKQVDLAIKNFDNKTEEYLQKITRELALIIGQMEVNIDYPEYEDIENIFNKELVDKLSKLKAQIEDLAKISEDARIIFDGIKIAIVGKPNVGKSSLLNALLNEEKAIVTDTPGTTRDIVEATVQVKGFLFKLFDTAGIRNSKNKIESAGIEKAIEQIKNANLVIHLLDNRKINDMDKKIEKTIKDFNKNSLIVFNKKDLIKNKKEEYIYIEANKKDLGILTDKLTESFNNIDLENNFFLNNARQLGLIKKAIKSINSAIETINNNNDLDLTIIDVREAWANLVDINGRADNESLLDEMFKNFCLGK